MEKISTLMAFSESLLEIGAKYRNVIVIDAGLASLMKTSRFATEFGDRYFNLGMAENNMVGVATGMALKSKIPFACSFAVFSSGKSWEQIRNNIAYPNLNVKIIGSHAGLMAGKDGVVHQALEDIGLMKMIPNMKVFCPADYFETKAVMKYMCEDFGPCYLRLSKNSVPLFYDDGYKFKAGRGHIVKDGKDATIFSTGSILNEVLLAVEMLEKSGLSIRVCNMCSVKPIDSALVLESAKKTKNLFSVEDHQVEGGLGSAIADVLATECWMCSLKKIGMNKFAESGSGYDLYRKYGLDSNGIFKEVKSRI
ncbi:MAG: transketolase C-terminal domain-containing protein [Candidatus Gracilibacteria bacterium]